jgi:hypothetical protein
MFFLLVVVVVVISQKEQKNKVGAEINKIEREREKC